MGAMHGPRARTHCSTRRTRHLGRTPASVGKDHISLHACWGGSPPEVLPSRCKKAEMPSRAHCSPHQHGPEATQLIHARPINVGWHFLIAKAQTCLEDTVHIAVSAVWICGSHHRSTSVDASIAPCQVLPASSSPLWAAMPSVLRMDRKHGKHNQGTD
eukprot:359747-Chlamydomonas_euryale.AAC.6